LRLLKEGKIKGESKMEFEILIHFPKSEK
jgi:hypothetical protein